MPQKSLPTGKPGPASSDEALEFIRAADKVLGKVRIGELSDEELEAELRRLAGGRAELEIYARRIMMDIFKRPQPKSRPARNKVDPKKAGR